MIHLTLDGLSGILQSNLYPPLDNFQDYFLSGLEIASILKFTAAKVIEDIILLTV